MGLELVSRDFKENMGFWMVYEGHNGMGRHILSLTDDVNMERVVTARSLGDKTGEDTRLP